MDLSTLAEFKDFVFSDESIKTIVLFLAWDMRGKFKEMKSAVEGLTVKLGALDEKNDARFGEHDKRFEEHGRQIEALKHNKTQGG